MAIKLMIGGSPCTHWSIAQKNHRETTAEGIGWELFKNYLIAKEKFNPDYFLYENNKSAAQPIKDQISSELGVDLTYINSALVSAQHRQRFYAFNWKVEQPIDRNIYLCDILEGGLVDRDKAYCLKHQAGNARDYFKKHHTQIAFESVEPGNPRYLLKNLRAGTDKSVTLTASSFKGVGSDGMTTVAKPVRIGDLPNALGEISGSQATRIYAINGKSINLVANGGGQGAKTGLYAIPVAFNGDVPLKAISSTDGNEYPVYRVVDGYIEIGGNPYPIKIEDGYYIIRKLTVNECCRLQTMPDDYCKAVSATQGYKGLGNGWTAEVIIHLLNHALKNVPRNKEIVVLSLSMTESAQVDTVSTRWDLLMSNILHTKLTSMRYRLHKTITQTSFNVAMLLQFVKKIGNHLKLGQNGLIAYWR